MSLCCPSDMVDTQLLAWPMGFSLTPVDLSELDDSSHSLDMKPYSTLDYTSISSSISTSISSSLSTSMTYIPSPPQSDHLANMDYTYNYKSHDGQSMSLSLL